MTDRSGSIPGLNAVMLLLTGCMIVAALLASARTEVRRPALVPISSAALPQNLPDMRIDLNRAGAAELTLLPGIGSELARRVVEDRMRNGPFETIDSLSRVHGIGPRTVQRLRAVSVISFPKTNANSSDHDAEVGQSG